GELAERLDYTHDKLTAVRQMLKSLPSLDRRTVHDDGAGNELHGIVGDPQAVEPSTVVANQQTADGVTALLSEVLTPDEYHVVRLGVYDTSTIPIAEVARAMGISVSLAVTLRRRAY